MFKICKIGTQLCVHPFTLSQACGPHCLGESLWSYLWSFIFLWRACSPVQRRKLLFFHQHRNWSCFSLLMKVLSQIDFLHIRQKNGLFIISLSARPGAVEMGLCCLGLLQLRFLSFTGRYKYQKVFSWWNIPPHTHTHMHTPKKEKRQKKKLIRINQMLSTLGKIIFLSLLLSFLMLSCRNAFLLSAELGHDSDGEQNSDKGNTLLDCRKTRHRNAPSQLRKGRINRCFF